MASPLVGKLIDGRFKIRKSLGSGSMGAVFAAEDPNGTAVAIKIVHDDVDEKLEAGQRFLREVKSLNQLVHPNVVELIDFGRDEKQHLSYMVMELLRGDPVSKLTEAGRSNPALALLVARQAAEGLHSAHKLGIVHRDLKPANLMLVPHHDGSVRVKVLDFGLAWMHADTRLTKKGTAPGTVSYMAPEQLQGNQFDGRTDIHALGIILYEMLTGTELFDADNQVKIAFQVLQHKPARLDKLVKGVDAELADIVEQCLAKDPDERPSTAEDLVDRIAAYQRSSGIGIVEVKHRGTSRDPVAAWKLRPPIRPT